MFFCKAHLFYEEYHWKEYFPLIIDCVRFNWGDNESSFTFDKCLYNFCGKFFHSSSWSISEWNHVRKYTTKLNIYKLYKLSIFFWKTKSRYLRFFNRFYDWINRLPKNKWLILLLLFSFPGSMIRIVRVKIIEN